MEASWSWDTTKIGYFAQNQAQLLDEEMTVFETIDRGGG